MKKTFFKITFLLVTTIIYSQNPEKEIGSWYMYNGNNQISESLSIKTSAHIRFFELTQFYQQEVYRAGLTYKVSDSFNLTGGMVYSIKEENYNSASNKTYEYRYYEDFNWKTKYNALSVKPRIRLEHSTNSNSGFEEFNHRIRFGTTLEYPVLKKTSVYVFNEVFLNFTPESFGENRIGAGLVKSMSDKLKLQFGYMHINFRETFLNRLQVGLLINTDLRKKTS
jgi:hypothetical protein